MWYLERICEQLWIKHFCTKNGFEVLCIPKTQFWEQEARTSSGLEYISAGCGGRGGGVASLDLSVSSSWWCCFCFCKCAVVDSKSARRASTKNTSNKLIFKLNHIFMGLSDSLLVAHSAGGDWEMTGFALKMSNVSVTESVGDYSTYDSPLSYSQSSLYILYICCEFLFHFVEVLFDIFSVFWRKKNLFLANFFLFLDITKLNN